MSRVLVCQFTRWNRDLFKITLLILSDFSTNANLTEIPHVSILVFPTTVENFLRLWLHQRSCIVARGSLRSLLKLGLLRNLRNYSLKLKCSYTMMEWWWLIECCIWWRFEVFFYLCWRDSLSTVLMLNDVIDLWFRLVKKFLMRGSTFTYVDVSLLWVPRIMSY